MPRMALDPSSPVFSGSVALYGTTFPEGEVLPKVQVTILGNEAKLLARNAERMMYETVDRITDIDIIEDDDLVTLTGISDQLVQEIGLTADQAEVKWVLTLKGCATC